MINAGEIPEVDRPDFMLASADREDTILDNILKVAGNLSGRGIDFQVMSPKHTGTLGVTNLNQELRKIINPPEAFKQEYAVGGESLREGDRVMVVKNNYRLGIVNGDIGKVLRIDRANKVVVAQVGVDQTEIPLADVKDFLRMAYATTIHKCQGQEMDIILLPLHTSFRHQLQRNLLYTAITRAKKRVLLFGQKQALVQAIQNSTVDQRNTRLADRLKSDS